jgi:hypothetical protein
VSETVYNLDDTVQSVQRAVGSTVAQTYATYTYTDNGLVASAPGCQEQSDGYQYDGHDRKVKTLYRTRRPTRPPAPTTSSTAGTNANLTSLKAQRPEHHAGLRQPEPPASRTYPSTADNVAYTYDLLGRRLAAAVAADNVSYAYDNAGAWQHHGQRQDPELPGRRRRQPHAHHLAGRVLRDHHLRRAEPPDSDQGERHASLAGYAYDDLSRRTTVTLGNGTSTTYGYDARPRYEAWRTT